MIEIIMSTVGYALVALFSVMIYIYVISKALPDICIRWEKPEKSRGDRGIKKYNFPEGRGVVYEPELKIRKYIRQYVLVSHNGDKYLKCLLNEKVREIKYDIIVYGPENDLLDVITVSEKITVEKYSKAVPLPEDTSYVNIVLRMADDMYTSSERVLNYSKISLLVLSLAVVFSTVVESFIVRTVLVKAMELYNIGQLQNYSMSFFIYSLLLGVACAALFLLSYYIRTIKVVNHERR